MTNSALPDEAAESPDSARTHRDEASLRRLLTTYAIAVDERDWPTLQSVFASGARIDYSKALGPTGPIEEILPWMQSNMNWEVLPRCQHMLSNVLVTVDRNEGHGRADYLNADVFPSPEGSHSLVVHSGVYRAEFRREATWLVTSLHAELYWRHEPPSDTVTFLFLDQGSG